MKKITSTKNKLKEKKKRKSLDGSKKQLVGYLISFVSLLLIGVVILGISIYGLDNKESEQVNLEIYNVGDNDAQSAFFELKVAPGISFAVNQFRTMEIYVDTGGKMVRSADLVLNFDSNKLVVGNVTGGSIFTNYSHATADSTIKISGFFHPDQSNHSVKGKFLFATVEIKPTSTHDQSIAIECRRDATNDSNITYQGKDIINCGMHKAFVLNNIQTNNTGSNANNTNQSTSTNSGSSNNPGVQCRAAAPAPVVNVLVKPGSRVGQIDLEWQKSTGSTHYSIHYGEKWLSFDKAIADTGDVNQYQVNGLKTNTVYYFVLKAHNGCASSNYSEGRASYAGIGSSTASVSQHPTQSPGLSQQKPSKYTWEQPSTGEQKGTIKEGLQTGYPKGNSATVSASPRAIGTVEKSPDVTTTPSTSSKPDETNTPDGLNFDSLLQYLPWLGLGVLGVLTVMLIYYVRRKRREFASIESAFQAGSSESIETNKDAQKEPQEFVFPEGWNK